jgi:transcriptional regulator with XRE-family HTH domain
LAHAIAAQTHRDTKAMARAKYLHRTYIGMIERAEKNITLINIEKIAKALNVSITEIFNDTQK